MTLEEAIECYEKISKEQEKAANECKKCAEEHRQLAEWLKELKKYQEKDRYNNYDVCLGGFHKD